MSSNHTKLRAWIYKQVFGSGGADSPVKIGVFHIAAGRYGGRVGTYTLPVQYDNDNVESEIDCLADEIIRDAEHDSHSVSESGAQSYAAISMVENENHVSRFPFRTKPQYDDNVVATDTPDQKGLMNQLMRHNETRERTSNQMLGTMMAYMTRVIDSLQEENTRMADERVRVMEVTQKLLSEQQERDLLLAEHEAKQENIQEMMSNVRLLLPAIAAKLTGNPAVKDENGALINPKEEALRQLLSSLSPEQQQAIQGVLSPQQIMALVQFMPKEN